MKFVRVIFGDFVTALSGQVNPDVIIDLWNSIVKAASNGAYQKTHIAAQYLCGMPVPDIFS